MLPRFYYFFVFVTFASQWRQGLGDFMSISIDVEFFVVSGCDCDSYGLDVL